MLILLEGILMCFILLLVCIIGIMRRSILLTVAALLLHHRTYSFPIRMQREKNNDRN